MEKQNVSNMKNLSLWLKDGLKSNIPVLNEDLQCDVCIIGAGITGIAVGYRLNEAGYKVVLIDKQEPLNLATGNTTAKFTFQHSLIYSDIIENYGEDKAKLYYQSQLKGMAYVRSLIEKHNIQCDFKETSAIVYAVTEEDREDLLKEKDAYKQLNIPHEIVTDLPFNIKGNIGLKVDSQFELNPVKYLDFLITYLMTQGVLVYKNTEAKNVEREDDDSIITTTSNNTIISNQLVIATAYPFFEGNGLYYTRLEAHRSYLLAFEIEEDKKYDDIMMISHSSSSYSLRFSKTDGINYLLVGGQGNKVGQAISEMESNQRLVDFARSHFDVSEPVFKWSAQDYKPLDTIPYIGRLTSKFEDIYVATGFNKWGMSNGSFASILLTDLIRNKQSRYEELFNPSRGDVTGNIGEFVKANLNVAKEMIKGKVVQDEIELGDIKNDEGGIIKYDGQRVAAYRDDNGKLFLSDSTCTHLGCELEYNDSDRSFDCPCHGSRFNYDGKVLEGAATTDLKKIK